MTTKDQLDSPNIPRSFFWSVLALTLLVAVLKRIPVIAPPGFPIGEGGLFVLFSQVILANGFALPNQIVYGGVTLPFAYPPAGFYFAAAVSRVTGAGLLDVYYWLPLLFNILAVPAFCFLAAQLTRDRIVFLCASILYVQIPESYIWQITGGGLPRSFAALFALVAVGLALRVSGKSSKGGLLLSGICVGLAILSHLEWGIFAALGVALAFLTRTGDWKKAVLMTVMAGVISLVVVLPWLVAVISRHGLDPFRSSASASAWNLGAFLSTVVRGRMFGILVWPATLGAFVTLARRQWFLTFWIVLTVLLTPRMGASAGFGIPASLLAGYGFKAAGEFAYRLLAPLRIPLPGAGQFAQQRWFSGRALALIPMLFYSFISATPIPALYHRPEVIEQVGENSRAAMQWIRTHTDPRSSFVVVTGAEDWYLDRIAEWFPFLTGRSSLMTAQGLEWAGPGVFADRTVEIGRFKLSQAGAPELTAQLVHERYCGANYVAVFAAPDAAERQSFLRSGSFQPVFANHEAAVFGQMASRNCTPSVEEKGVIGRSPRNAEAA